MKNLQTVTVGVSMNGVVESISATWAISGEVEGHYVAQGLTEPIGLDVVGEAAAKLIAAIVAAGGPLTDAQQAAKLAASAEATAEVEPK
jgi:hypothetical protein